MVQKLVLVVGLLVSAALVGCGAEPDPALDQAVESTQAQLSLAAPTTTPTRTPTDITSNVGDSEKKSCTCGDHPKPGYNCNSCFIHNGACWCTYGIKSR